jgi:hypothetical protein
MTAGRLLRSDRAGKKKARPKTGLEVLEYKDVVGTGASLGVECRLVFRLCLRVSISTAWQRVGKLYGRR